MKVTIKGWIVRYQPSYLSEPRWNFDQYNDPPRADDDQIPICQHSFEVEVPDGEMIAERVHGVREEIARTYVRAEEQVVKLREVESKLLALTNEVSNG